MSAPQDPAPPKRKKDEGLDGRSYEEVEAFLLRLSPTRRRIFRQLLQEIAQGDFWTKKRAVQAIRLAASRKKYGIKQYEIGKVLDVSETIISRNVKRYKKTATEEPPRSGPKSQLSDVFGVIQNFIDAKNRQGKAVTMGVLTAYVNDKLRVPVTKQTLKKHMKWHDSAISWQLPLMLPVSTSIPATSRLTRTT